MSKIKALFDTMLKQGTFRKFIVAFSITMVACVLIAGGVYAVMRHVIREPELDREYIVIPPLSTPVTNNPINTDIENDEYENNNDSPYTEKDDEPSNNEPNQDGRMYFKPSFHTFLIIGIDQGGNVDLLMVAAYDALTQQTSLISIPRDIQVIPYVNRRPAKIVNAYNFGRAGGRGHDEGIRRLKREVESIIGFTPDFYVMLEYALIERVIDAVGGVDVYVWRDMIHHDSTPGMQLHINLRRGQQRLNGEQAIHFARFRTSNLGYQDANGNYVYGPSISDYQRIENQQAVLHAFVRQLNSPSTILRIPEFINAYNEHLRTNMTLGYMLWFGTEFMNAQGGFERIETYTLPTRGTSGAPSWYELPDPEAIVELVNNTVNPFTTPITVDMLRIHTNR